MQFWVLLNPVSRKLKAIVISSAFICDIQYLVVRDRGVIKLFVIYGIT